MSALSPEILLSTFKKLKPNEFVKISSVCKDWFDIIDKNTSLWKDLVLRFPKDGQDEQKQLHGNQSVLDLFDRKSRSSLNRVSMPLHLDDAKIESLVEVLEKSKDTLETLHLFFEFKVEKPVDEMDPYRIFAPETIIDLSWKLPNLIDFRVVEPWDWNSQKVRLIIRKENKTDTEREKIGSNLKVLWIPEYRALFKFHPALFANLVSLKVEEEFRPMELRDVLAGVSKSLRHLSFRFVQSQNPNDFGISDLDLPKLKFLQMTDLPVEFPTWIKIPTSTIFFTDICPTNPPPVSTIWLKRLVSLRSLDSLQICPTLSVLRILGMQLMFRNKDPSTFKLRATNVLITTLKKRKEIVIAGTVIDGVKVENIRTLYIRFSEVDESGIEELGRLVEELIDLDSTSQDIEIEL